MKIVFYNKTLISGGIEKCIEILSKYIYNKYELEVVYVEDSILDPNVVKLISKYAKVYKIEDGMQINCDICIWCYQYIDYDRLKRIIHADKYISWLHSMPRILPNYILDNEEFLDTCSDIICVSEAVKNNLNLKKEGQVIHNFIDPDIKLLALESNPLADISTDTLKLVMVSRLSRGKGFDRLVYLCQSLKKANIKFKVTIVGKGRSKESEIRNNLEVFEEVEFIGYRDNPHPYIVNSDYLVQLSDEESWCNSITESKILGVPVVVTNFESASEQIIDGENGIVVDLNVTNYDEVVNRMINLKEKLKNNLKSFKYTNEIDKWLKIFEEK